MDTYKLPSLKLQASMTVGDAARLIFEENTQHLRVNRHRFCESYDGAALMQMRIAMRRLRVAIGVFKGVLDETTRKYLKQEFRHFGRLTGAARDLDVLLRGLLQTVDAPAVDIEDVRELRQQIKTLRQVEYSRIKVELVGGRYTAMMEKLDHLSIDMQEQGAPPILPFAIEVTAKGRTKLLKKGEETRDLSVEELHDIRKIVKRARYHLRFFASLINVEKVRAGYKILVPMQDSLGKINDIGQAVRLLGQIAGQVPAGQFEHFLNLSAAILKQAAPQVSEELASYAISYQLYKDYSLSAEDFS